MEKEKQFVKLVITLNPPTSLTAEKTTKATYYFDACNLLQAYEICKELQTTILNNLCSVSFEFSESSALAMQLARINNDLNNNDGKRQYLRFPSTEIFKTDFEKLTKPIIDLSNRYKYAVASSEIDEY